MSGLRSVGVAGDGEQVESGLEGGGESYVRVDRMVLRPERMWNRGIDSGSCMLCDNKLITGKGHQRQVQKQI
jgi:hypothetical protein